MFDLLFSPLGCVSRQTWWLTQLFYFSFAGLTLLSMTPLLEDLFGVPNYHLLGIDQVQDLMHVIEADISGDNQGISETVAKNWPAVKAQIYGILGVFALATWTRFVVDLKRWRDRDMSVLFGFLPVLPFVASWLGYDSTLVYAIAFCVAMFMLVELGLLGEPSSAPLLGRRARRARPSQAAGAPAGPAAPSAPPAARGDRTAVHAALIALVIFALIVGAFIAAWTFNLFPPWLMAPLRGIFDLVAGKAH